MEEYLGLFMTPTKATSLKRNASPPEPPAESGAMKRGKTQESELADDCVIEPSQSLEGSTGIVSLDSIVKGVSSSIDKLLDDKLKVICDKISNMNGSLETMKSELQSLRASQNQLDAKQKKADKRHEELGKMVEDVRQGAKDQLEKAKKEFQSKEQEIEKKFGEKITKSNVRIRDFETTAQYMSEQFDSFKSTQSEVADNVRELKRMRVITSEVRDAFESVREKVDTFEPKHNALEKRLHSLEEEFRRDSRAVRDELETATVRAQQPQEPVGSDRIISLASVQDVIREELRSHERSQNVILSGILEEADENLHEKIASLLPGLDRRHP